ncbi:hybrid sensor histidine kinase/response regulator [Gemmobacter serpentinus]|uniref:hybrid sensor histidine kinase/response regulator n=1 Tax=Gemmobacter serpentinus TaxID=2652247 RepID=UPI00124D7A89|nr:PAS domain-containing sensor histidine kinase [Gemmobacter serpentinus]
MPAKGSADRLGQAERLVLWFARRLWPVMVMVVLAIIGLLVFGYNVNSRLDDARAAQSDNTAWLIAQSEVDTLKLDLALRETLRSGDLEAVRTAYDIYVSRINIVDSYFSSSKVLRPLAGSPDWAEVKRLTSELGVLIDVPDNALRLNLVAAQAHTDALRQPVRQFAVDALGLQIASGLLNREALTWLLVRAAALGLAVILFLFSAVWVMAYLALSLRARHKEVERARGNLERTLAATPDGVLVVASDGRVRDANRAAEAILGRALGEMRGLRVQEFLLTQLGETGLTTMLRRARQGYAPDRHIEMTARRADGTEVPIELVMTRGEDADGVAVVFMFLRDISRRHEYEQSLRAARDAALQAAEARTRFLAVMSHEMRTPMNGVIAALDILMRTTRLSRKQARFTEIAERSAQLALDQINDILEMAHLEGGNAEEPPSVFNVTELLRDLADQMQPLAARNDNRLSVEAPPEAAAWVTGPRRRLLRVLINLAGNAAKFTQNGRIDIRAAFLPDMEPQEDLARRRTLLVEVVDTGIGIAPERIDAIFEPFETLEDSYDRRTEGTGLGLGIARRTLERIGGTLGVDSRPGEGSRFWFRLPLLTAAPPPPGHMSDDGNEADLPVLDVLIAEDNATNRVVLGEMLLHLGQRVTEARDGAEAVAAAQTRAFDLILMDVSMPLVDGLVATRRIREAGASKGARIVALTAHGFPEELARFRAGGLTEILQKPVTLAALRPLLAGSVAASGAALDADVISDLCALLSLDKRLKLLEGLHDEAQAFLSVLGRGVASDEVARRAHRLQGAASVLGARDMMLALRRLEAHFNGSEPGDPQALTRRFSVSLQTTMADLPAALTPEIPVAGAE